MNDIFNRELNQCRAIFDRHDERKGDSWRRCTVEFLELKLLEEVDEWLSDKSNINELGDIINVALMLMSRLNNQNGTLCAELKYICPKCRHCGLRFELKEGG